MIGIAESDRNYLKFLWFNDDTHNYEIMRVTRVTLGCTSSPNFLTSIIKNHIKGYRLKNTDNFEMLNSSLFDDLVSGSNAVQKAYQVRSDPTSILRDAGMKLRKVSTNSKELRQLWEKSDRFSNLINNSRVLNILGLVWDKIEDKRGLELKSIAENIDMSDCTKKVCLEYSCKMF